MPSLSEQMVRRLEEAVAHLHAHRLKPAMSEFNTVIETLTIARRRREPVDQWTPELSTALIRAHIGRGLALSKQGELAAAMGAFETSINIGTALQEMLEPLGRWTLELRDVLAKAHMNRGNLLSDQGNLVAAVSAYDAAIEIRLGIRTTFEPLGQWTSSLQNSLALTHLNRGALLLEQRQLPAALAAFDAAIEIMDSVRSELEPLGQWSPEACNDLAAVHVNRASVLYRQGDLDAAVAAYENAAKMMMDVRGMVEPIGQWSPELRNDLVSTYVNLANVLSDKWQPRAVLVACDAAIEIGVGLRTMLEPIKEWTPTLRNTLGAAYMHRANALSDLGELARAVRAYDATVEVRVGIRAMLEPRGRWTLELRRGLANAHMKRGDALAAQDDSRAAAEAYEAAIEIRTGIRQIQEPQGQWTTELRTDLATLHGKRASILSELGDLAAAVKAYDAVIEIWAGLRSVLEPRGQWTSELCNNLIAAQIDRGNALAHQGKSKAALVAYDAAIEISTGARQIFEPRGRWTPTMQDTLMTAFLNRGNVLRELGDLAGALAAYETAIEVRTGIRRVLEPRGQWKATFRDRLAVAHLSRANALSDQGNLAAAVAAYDIAIEIRTGLRAMLEPRGQWTSEFRDGLAATHMNRGNALLHQGELAAAIAAYDVAVEIRTDLRASLEPREQWTPRLRNALAQAHMNRGAALSQQGELTAAVANCDAAIEIRNGLRLMLEPLGQWTPELRDDLAGAHINRGVALAEQDELAGALEAYEAAIEIKTAIRRMLEPLGQWTPELRNNLASAHMNRATRFSIEGEGARAIADYDTAIEIRTSLRTMLEPLGQWHRALRNDLAGTHMNRGRALLRHGESTAAVAACNEAISLLGAEPGEDAVQWVLRVGAQTTLGEAQLSAGNITAALTAFESALTERDSGQGSLTATELRLSLSERTSGLGSMLAWCHIRQDRLCEALDRLERAQASELRRELIDELQGLPIEQRTKIERLQRLVRNLEARIDGILRTSDRAIDGAKARRDAIEELRQTRAEMGRARRAAGLGQKGTTLSMADMLSLAPRDGVLVAPIVTDLGGFVFVLPHGAKDVLKDYVLDLPQLKTAIVKGWMTRWFEAYRAFAKDIASGRHSGWQSFDAAIQGVLKEVSQILMAPVVTRARELGLRRGGAGEIIILPTGGVGLLPLHAAPIDNTGECALDEHAVSYTPSLLALKTARTRAKNGKGEPAGLLGIFNPEANLEWTEAWELPAIQSCFERNRSSITICKRDRATANRLVEEAPQCSYLHFSCHGTFVFGEPKRSGVILAKERGLTESDRSKQRMGELFDLRRIANELALQDCRLVSLAACESGVTAPGNLAEEQVGLPAAFLQAGAAGVIAALWPIADESTAVLMSRFYDLHLTHQLSPARALRQAVLDLRNGRLDTPVHGHSIRDVKVEISSGSLSKFNRPFFWAPYVAVGA